MPIYAYKCESCGHAKDVLQKLSDTPLSVCPACGAATFAKQVTAAGFQLKGSGWYVTDFRGGNTAKAPEGDAKAEAKTEGAVEAKSDSKSELKSEAKSDTSTTKPAESKASESAPTKSAPAAPARTPASGD